MRSLLLSLCGSALLIAGEPATGPIPTEAHGGNLAVLPDRGVQAIIDRAIALGYPDTRNAHLFIGTLKLTFTQGQDAQSVEIEGVHAQLPDGTWMIRGAFPVPASPAVSIDGGGLREVAVESFSMAILSGRDDELNGRRQNHRRGFTRYEPAQSVQDLLRFIQQDSLIIQVGASATLIHAGVMHPQEILAGMLSPPRLTLEWGPPVDIGFLGLCPQRIGNSDVACARTKRTPPPSSPEQVMRNGLIHWFLANAHGLPHPFVSLPADAARAGARGLVSADDPSMATQIRLFEELERSPTAPTADAPTQRLFAWHTAFNSDMDVQHRKLLDDYLRDPDGMAEYLRGYIKETVNSQFKEDELPMLFGALSNLHASSWLDRGQWRTISDQAVRAIASVFAFDPRCLIGRNVEALWTDQERAAVVRGLTTWWAANQHRSVTEIRLAALDHMDMIDACYLLKYAALSEAQPLFSRMAVLWKKGPPEGFDDYDLLERAEKSPDLMQAIQTWPAVGTMGPMLLQWQCRHGGTASFSGYFDDTLAREDFSEHWDVWFNDAIQVLGTHPDKSAMQHLLGILAQDPSSRTVGHLMRYCLDPHRHDTVVTMVDNSGGTRPRDVMNLVLYCRMLCDQRPAPVDLAGWTQQLPRVHKRGQPSSPPASDQPVHSADLRIADCAAARAQRIMWSTCGGLSGKPDAVTLADLAFDMDAPIQERDAKIARMLTILHGVIPTVMKGFGVEVEIPVFDHQSGPVGAAEK